MKTFAYTLSVVLLLFSFTLKAQQDSYRQFGIGFGASQVKAYSDLNTNYNKYAYNITGTYNLTPYIPIAAEFQFGKLSGGGLTIDPHGRAFTNSYKAFIVHADAQLGEFIDYYDSFLLGAVRNFYVGTGVGFISNNMTSIQRNDPYQPGRVFPGANSSTGLLVPLRIGYEFKIFNTYDEQAYAVDIGYRYNVTFGEGLDGYNDPPTKFKNNSPDCYSQLYIGFKVNIGDLITYKKPIGAGYGY